MSKYLSFNNYEDFCERMGSERNEENNYRKIIIITIDGRQITIIINPDPSIDSFNLSDFLPNKAVREFWELFLLLELLLEA